MTTRPPSPYDALPDVGSFAVISNDIADGETLPMAQVSGILGAGGSDVSPHLAWSGFPAETKSFVVTCFDPDAPTGSGFWHWTMYNISSSVTELASDAGNADGSGFPDGAGQLKHDGGGPGYIGAGPPPGHGPHRYMFAVHALGVDSLPINDDVSNAVCGFNMFTNVLARAIITPVWER